MNIKRYSKLVITILICFSAIDLSAQPYSAILKKLHSEYPREKIYLHYDKDIYFPGETIWFKAYLFSGNFPSDISKVLYADLLDSDGNVLDHKILPVIQSSSSASFHLSPNINGLVYVRCYTKWMLNFDSTLLYEKNINISDATRSPGHPSSSANIPVSYHLEFFPEGGILVEDVESRIAFRATDESGQPVNINGTITNNTDKSVLLFQTSHDGMGSLRLTPLKNTIYLATCKQGTKEFTAELPHPQKSGVVLEMSPADDAIVYTIKRPEDNPVCPFVYLVGQMNDQLIYQAKVPIENDEITSGKVTVAGLPSGIIQFTLFTSEAKPIAERLVFANKRQCSFPVNVNTSYSGSADQIKTTIGIEISDSIPSNLSISVTSNNPVTARSIQSIYASLLMAAGLNGYTSNPDLYFSDHDSASRYLDLVMMTHKFQGFEWEKLLSGHFSKLLYKPELSLTVEGEISGPAQKDLLEKDLIGVVELKSGDKYFVTTPVTKDKKFSFSNLLFYDSAKLFYQFNNDKKGVLTRQVKFTTYKQVIEEGVRISLKKPSVPAFTSNTSNVSNNPEITKENQMLPDSPNVKELKGVTITSRTRSKKDSLNDEYTSGAFTDQLNSRTIIPDDDPAFQASQSLFDYLQGRFPGLEINPTSDENPITWRGSVTSLFVNEISQRTFSSVNKIIEDGTYIRSLAMSDIALVKIFNAPFVGAWANAPGGCIAVYLKRGSLQKPQAAKEFVILRGYSKEQEFQSSDYLKNAGQLQSGQTNLLYWNPHIITDKDHRKVTCSFYSNAFPGPFKIIIEGCNYDGKLIRIEKIINKSL